MAYKIDNAIVKKDIAGNLTLIDPENVFEDEDAFIAVKSEDQDITWYRHKDCNCYSNNYFCFYLYFGVSKRGNILPLHLKIEYQGGLSNGKYSIKKISYTVDGMLYEYLPDPFKYNSKNRSLESDEQITYSSRKLINALLTAQKVTVVITPSGAQWVETKLSDSQILKVKRTIELYKAMGGFYVTKDNF